MQVPAPLARRIFDLTSLTIRSADAVAGGSINRSARLHTDRGELFLKWNTNPPEDMFEREADGLERLRNAGTKIRIPEVFAGETSTTGVPGFLLMEYIPSKQSSTETFEAFGVELARLHSRSDRQFGLCDDNYIGRLPQSNRKHDSWSDFFILQRIEPQLKMAIDSNILDQKVLKAWGRLAGKLPTLFPENLPALLHGDLWSGNYFSDLKDRPVLIDPAVYYGHPEMELAFTKMFGGFSDAFYKAYSKESHMEPGFSDRIPIYNLYPLLVHANLFNGHYTDQVRSFFNRF